MNDFSTVVVRTDVSQAAGLPGPVFTVASVLLPPSQVLSSPPVVVFGFSGGGYGRGYYTFDMPGSDHGGQAGYHAARHGFVFVACDLLGVGESKVPRPGDLTWDAVIGAMETTVQNVMRLLGAGTLLEGCPPVVGAVRIGLGQSMGGCFTIAAQGRRAIFDAVAILGFSGIHTSPDGGEAPPLPKLDIDEHIEMIRKASAQPGFGAGFHWPDVPEEIVKADLTDYPVRNGDLPEWASATMPGCALTMLTPGVVAKEAAAIDVPVLVAAGEIDLVPHPRSEPAAYSSSPDVTVVIIPRMAHMHNFAGTRVRLWERIGAWIRGVSAGGHKALSGGVAFSYERIEAAAAWGERGPGSGCDCEGHGDG
ncbi:MAG TPA: hypothetical protein VJM34_14285 [Novosphingobium sp.]|nr:hypothetical protein [Novosphingobium sp.]